MTEQPPFAWPQGARCAVSLTYDDALEVHREEIAPFLAAKGLAGTFYLNAHQGLTDAPEKWRPVAKLGHELGNHTLFHPCRRIPPERFDWLAPHYDLCDYTMQRWHDEARINNCLLHLIDGRTERTYAAPCGNTTVGPAGRELSLDAQVLKLFAAGRGRGCSRVIDPATANLAALDCWGGDGRTFADLRQAVEQAAAQGGWLIFICHGVGRGTHGSFIEPAEHTALVEWLADQAGRVWTAPTLEVARWLKRAPNT